MKTYTTGLRKDMKNIDLDYQIVLKINKKIWKYRLCHFINKKEKLIRKIWFSRKNKK